MCKIASPMLASWAHFACVTEVLLRRESAKLMTVSENRSCKPTKTSLAEIHGLDSNVEQAWEA